MILGGRFLKESPNHKIPKTSNNLSRELRSLCIQWPEAQVDCRLFQSLHVMLPRGLLDSQQGISTVPSKVQGFETEEVQWQKSPNVLLLDSCALTRKPIYSTDCSGIEGR